MPALATPLLQVALVEDDDATRERFCAAIVAAPDLVLAGAFATGGEALAWLKLNAPDVLLVDLGLPDVPGLAVIDQCARQHQGCDIMVISMYEDEAHVVRSLEAGASGYLLKDSFDDEIARHIRELRAGGAPMTPIIARHLIKKFRGLPRMGPAGPPAASTPLSPREQLILTRISQGFSYGEIAELESISRNTVHSHIKNIYSKLSVHSRTEAVFEASRLGWLGNS
ncbi:response regulator transcription factor [soil metagenome]